MDRSSTGAFVALEKRVSQLEGEWHSASAPHISAMRKLPPLHALRAFEAAARHLNFSRAADELALTPTAISHQVRLLEETLNVSLFRRFPRPLALTAEGAALFAPLRDALDRMAEAVAVAKGGAAHEPLTVSCAHSFALRWLMPRVAALREATGLELAIDADDRMVDLHAGTVDLAIRYIAAPSRDFAHHALFRDRFVPVAAPSLVAAHGMPADPAGVLRLPLVFWRWKARRADAPSWERWLVEAMPSAAPALPPPALRLSEEAHAIEAALAGQGVALASDVEVALEVEAGRLVQVSPVGIPGLTFFAVHRKAHRRAPDIARFTGWARAEVSPA
jgi:LysR family transcriptional regulator, glycine cleavage system transcriptional activator